MQFTVIQFTRPEFAAIGSTTSLIVFYISENYYFEVTRMLRWVNYHSDCTADRVTDIQESTCNMIQNLYILWTCDVTQLHILVRTRFCMRQSPRVFVATRAL